MTSTEHVVKRVPPHPLVGPGFGSYAPQDVGWLLTDLSQEVLEAPTEEREEAVQVGGAHYAESLPIEYQPSLAYQTIFRASLLRSADRLAEHVGLVTESLISQRGPKIVLASLARAGTPIGILVRRWAGRFHGLDLPHFAVSIVRGRGIDRNALRYLASNYSASQVAFLDGWTGKGAITRELDEAVRAANRALGATFSSELAVLADPGSTVRTFGTREDYLIPSACLNSTVSGLVSRTVLKEGLIGPDDYHGAKFYRHLAALDVSNSFVDVINARFDVVRPTVVAALAAHLAQDREPTWAGWRQVELLAAEYGIGGTNLIKPGVGETTRVLLRRVPWKVLVRSRADEDLSHIYLLAEERKVPVEEVADLTYRCVGLIHPNYDRGAVGSDGRRVGRGS